MRVIYPDWLPRETFGQRVKRLRDAQHLSLRDMNRRCGINISNLSRVERGGDLSLGRVAQLADGFNMTASELLAGVDLSDLKQGDE